MGYSPVDQDVLKTSRHRYRCKYNHANMSDMYASISIDTVHLLFHEDIEVTTHTKQ